jgi:D-alanyl-D-alanine carboxypeptidase (penicillin-binding protein 5/6)
VRLFEDGKPIVEPEIWKGAQNTAKLGTAGDVVIAVPRGEGPKLKTEVERTDPLVAPLEKGQRVGTLKVTSASGAKVAEIPLVVIDPVPEAGLFGRAWDSLRLWIR